MQLEYVPFLTFSKLRRMCIRCLIALGIIVGILLLLLFGLRFFIWLTPPPPLVISEETTYLTGPLTNDGLIDYFKALEERFTPPELATDENGYRIFLRQFGDVVLGYDKRYNFLPRITQIFTDISHNGMKNIFLIFYFLSVAKIYSFTL